MQVLASIGNRKLLKHGIPHSEGRRMAKVAKKGKKAGRKAKKAAKKVCSCLRRAHGAQPAAPSECTAQCSTHVRRHAT